MSEEPVSEQRQKTFAVRLLVQRLVAVIFQYAVGDVFDFRRHVEATLRPQEKAVARLESATQNDMFVKVRMAGARCEPEVLGPSFGIESRLDGYGFEQRRFSHAVLAHDERHGPAEFQPPEVGQRRNGVRIGLRRFVLLFQADVFDVERIRGQFHGGQTVAFT